MAVSGARKTKTLPTITSAQAQSKASSAPVARHDDPRSLVNSLAKGLRLLESFTSERTEMTLSQAASAAELDPGTAFRMLNTLAMLGYIARVPDSKRFRLTLKCADLGFHAIGHADPRDLARPMLRELVGEVNEAASLGVLDGGDILYIERVRAGAARLGVDIRIGTTIPAFCSAIGQVVLAFLPPREVDRVLGAVPRPGGMPAIALNRTTVRSDIANVRRTGYALRDSYFGSGLRVLAVAVRGIDGYPIAAVSVSAPAIRIGMEDFRRRALAPVQTAAAEIARAFQASGSVAASI